MRKVRKTRQRRPPVEIILTNEGRGIQRLVIGGERAAGGPVRSVYEAFQIRGRFELRDLRKSRLSRLLLQHRGSET